MKIKCPHCGQRYEIENEHLGTIAECSNCNQEFVVESIPQTHVPVQLARPISASSTTSVPLKAEPHEIAPEVLKKRRHSPRIGILAIAGILFLAIISLAILISWYYFSPNKWRAINNRAAFQRQALEKEFVISNSSAVTNMCNERAGVEFKEAEKLSLTDDFIKFWCDGNVSEVLNFVMAQSGDNHSAPSDNDQRKMKKLLEEIEIKHPQINKVCSLIDIAEKNYSPQKILLKNGYGRSRLLADLDQGFLNINEVELGNRAVQKFAEALYNSFSKNEEIKYPKKLREFCNQEARDIYQKILNADSALAADWAKLILSAKFDSEMKKGMSSKGKTIGALYWLRFHGEEIIPPLPYGCEMEGFLEVKNHRFWGKYYDISQYGSAGK